MLVVCLEYLHLSVHHLYICCISQNLQVHSRSAFHTNRENNKEKDFKKSTKKVLIGLEIDDMSTRWILAFANPCEPEEGDKESLMSIALAQFYSILIQLCPLTYKKYF